MHIILQCFSFISRIFVTWPRVALNQYAELKREDESLPSEIPSVKLKVQIWSESFLHNSHWGIRVKGKFWEHLHRQILQKKRPLAKNAVCFDPSNPSFKQPMWGVWRDVLWHHRALQHAGSKIARRPSAQTPNSQLQPALSSLCVLHEGVHTVLVDQDYAAVLHLDMAVCNLPWKATWCSFLSWMHSLGAVVDMRLLSCMRMKSV